MSTAEEAGIEVEDIVVGNGDHLEAPGSRVHLHYTLALNTFPDDGGMVIDSSHERGHEFSYTYKAGEVIQGWDLGMEGMKPGGKRKLVIPPHLGFGEAGVGASVPPNSKLYFLIELLSHE